MRAAAGRLLKTKGTAWTLGETLDRPGDTTRCLREGCRFAAARQVQGEVPGPIHEDRVAELVERLAELDATQALLR